MRITTFISCWLRFRRRVLCYWICSCITSIICLTIFVNGYWNFLCFYFFFCLWSWLSSRCCSRSIFINFYFLLLFFRLFLVEHICCGSCTCATCSSTKNSSASHSCDFLTVTRLFLLLLRSVHILYMLSLIIVLRLHDDCLFAVHNCMILDV